MADLRHVEVSSLRVHPANPRGDLGDLDELVASIRNDGILQPLVVVETSWSDDDTGPAFERGVRYWVVAGQRRLAAARRAGLQHVPVAVQPPMSEQRIHAVSLAENLARKSLNPIEEAEAFQRLLDTYDLTQDELAEQVGCSQGHISRRLKLLQLTEAQQRKVASGDVSAYHAEQHWVPKSSSRSVPHDYPDDPKPKRRSTTAGERGARIDELTPRPNRNGSVQLPAVPKSVWRTAKWCADDAGVTVEQWISEVIRRAARAQLGDGYAAEIASAAARERAS